MQKAKVAFLVLVVVVVMALAATAAAAPPDGARVFQAKLSGGEEVPANDSDAHGIAMFRLSRDGTSIEYTLVVNNLENTLQSHIHIGPAGVNGPVVVFLYPEGGPPPQLIEGSFSGKLASGTITEEDIILAGQTFESLLEAMRTGNAYVNVHTTAFPGGEIRGQIDGLGD